MNTPKLACRFDLSNHEFSCHKNTSRKELRMLSVALFFIRWEGRGRRYSLCLCLCLWVFNGLDNLRRWPREKVNFLDTTNLFLQTSYPSFTSCFLQEIFLFNIHIRHITCLIEYCHQFFFLTRDVRISLHAPQLISGFTEHPASSIGK